MSTALAGPTQGRKPGQRTAVMMVLPETRLKLVQLLHRPSMRGVGYTEFLDRCIAAAHEEIDEQGLEA